MKDDQEPYSKMKPSGLPGLLVVIFVLFAFASLFTPEDFTYLVLGIGGAALVLAIILRVVFSHQAEKDQRMSVLHSENTASIKAEHQTGKSKS